ncbi:MAG: tetraacyldisaccharide 4'-kinase, partial [Armatimonadetes bacterium]|nr:tetraacyldisaccharide 4'-kinase [Armatimonadota bacterium]
MIGSTDTRWERIVRGDLRRPSDRVAAAGLHMLSLAYAGALALHHAGYRVGLAKRTRVPARVIGLGNLTVGGTGKTTATLAVARWLAEQGHKVAVLSRGYRGRAERAGMLVSSGSGPLVSPEMAGDESYLLAEMLPGVAVLAGRDRRLTARRAIEEFAADTLVLDDAFQYQRLQKDVEIVLVDALAPFGYDFLVPRGLLRESPRHLARADAVWITHADLVRAPDLHAIRERVRRVAPRARLWEARHAPTKLVRWEETEGKLEPEGVRGRKIVALSSVGNPESFERTLEGLGAVLLGRARFADHHR